MNSIESQWLDALREDGSQHKIAPWQIAEQENPVIELVASRPDFLGGNYQFLIGLLQTVFSPEDHDQWLEYWETPPTAKELKTALQPFAPYFELINPDGPAFLQDFDLAEGEKKPIAALLIDAPGGKTIKDNLDHFVKRDSVTGCCEACAATALFTLQSNAPSGGVGHRVGLRGGGPMTTLLLPQTTAPLWRKIWLNILPQDHAEGYETVEPGCTSVLPWLASTRLSDKKGRATYPEDASPLQAYWGMPRRIRLEVANRQPGQCDLCGSQVDELITHYRTKNYGINYEGAWVHPLSPYKRDPKNEKPPLSLKGRQGGLGYQHWLGLVWKDNDNNEAAQITTEFNNSRVSEASDDSLDTVRLWCFGYDMDNMKARCWYEQRMPLLNIHSDYREDFIHFVSQLIDAAKDTVKLLRSQVKSAWFERPKDASGDISSIDQSFWQATETSFYELLHGLVVHIGKSRLMPISIAEKWLITLRKAAETLFDHWVLEGEAEDMPMKRIMGARRLLIARLYNAKSMPKSLKGLDHITRSGKEAA